MTKILRLQGINCSDIKVSGTVGSTLSFSCEKFSNVSIAFC